MGEFTNFFKKNSLIYNQSAVLPALSHQITVPCWRAAVRNDTAFSCSALHTSRAPLRCIYSFTSATTSNTNLPDIPSLTAAAQLCTTLINCSATSSLPFSRVQLLMEQSRIRLLIFSESQNGKYPHFADKKTKRFSTKV